jgi:hypothetical protein
MPRGRCWREADVDPAIFDVCYGGRTDVPLKRGYFRF